MVIGLTIMIQCIALHNPGVYLWGGNHNTIIEYGSSFWKCHWIHT